MGIFMLEFFALIEYINTYISIFRERQKYVNKIPMFKLIYDSFRSVTCKFLLVSFLEVKNNNKCAPCVYSRHEICNAINNVIWNSRTVKGILLLVESWFRIDTNIILLGNRERRKRTWGNKKTYVWKIILNFFWFSSTFYTYMIIIIKRLILINILF